MPIVRALLVALLLAVPASALAATPSDLSRDPLDRAALLALPSVYRIEATTRIEALETADGRRVELPPAARTLVERGTAFGIAPDGVLVTAGHVVAPTPAEIARDAYLVSRAVRREAHSLEAAEEWVARTGARPVGRRGPVLEATPARASGADGEVPDPIAGRLVAVERSKDIAVVDIAAPGAPALALDGGRTRGTPVVVLGYGDTQGATPRVETGRLGLTGSPDDQPERLLTEVDVPVRQGDSGGPVVDADGRARGLVLARFAGGGWIAPASEIRDVADAAGIELAEGATAASFRSAMNDLWALDLEGARRGLDETLDRFPQHALAAREVERTGELAGAEYALAPVSRRRGFLLSLGVLAIVGAVACGARLGVIEMGGRR